MILKGIMAKCYVGVGSEQWTRDWANKLAPHKPLRMGFVSVEGRKGRKKERTEGGREGGRKEKPLKSGRFGNQDLWCFSLFNLAVLNPHSCLSVLN